MMDETVERYLSLLRLGLWGPAGQGAGRRKEGIGIQLTEEVFALAGEQATTGLVARYSAEERHQDELLYLKFQWHQQVQALREVKAELDEAGIPFVLLKGLGCDHYYQEQGIRRLGDIDIYVGEENYPLAARLFGCDPTAQGSPKHFRTEVNDVTVEIHRACQILPQARADKRFQELAAAGLGSDLRTLDIGGVEVRTPADDFNAIYLFIHFFDHFLGGGCGLRQVCDWAVFLHAKRETLNRRYLASALKSLGLVNAWQTFGALAVAFLGLPVAEMPLLQPGSAPMPPCQTRRARRLLRVILRMGNFGTLRKQSRARRFGTRFLARKLGSLLGALQHTLELLTLFPGHSLRGISRTLLTSTARSLRQLSARNGAPL